LLAVRLTQKAKK